MTGETLHHHENPEDMVDYESPFWDQGYKDGWDNKEPVEPKDVTYFDGFITGRAEREGGLNRDGSLPWAEDYLQNEP